MTEPKESDAGELAVTSENAGAMGLYLNEHVKSQLMGTARVMSESDLVPKEFKGKPQQCLLVCLQALRLQEDPITLAQNMHFIHGKPGLGAQYLIDRANRSGLIARPIRFSVEGSVKGGDLAVTAFAELAEDGFEIRATVSLEMAKIEGWTQKNTKWRSMPEHMLHMRAGTMLIRRYLPELIFGPIVDVESGEGSVRVNRRDPRSGVQRSPLRDRLRARREELREESEGAAEATVEPVGGDETPVEVVDGEQDFIPPAGAPEMPPEEDEDGGGESVQI